MVRHGRQAPLEASERVPTAFDVRIVGREHADVVARLLDDPPRVLVRVRRHAHLAGEVLAWSELELLEAFLVPTEGVGGGVARPHQPGEPGRTLLDDAEAE